MEMTIEEIIQELERTKDYPASDPASDEALDGAIDIIHKYLKIVQVLSDWKVMGYNENDGLYSLLSRVVEDE